MEQKGGRKKRKYSQESIRNHQCHKVFLGKIRRSSAFQRWFAAVHTVFSWGWNLFQKAKYGTSVGYCTWCSMHNRNNVFPLLHGVTVHHSEGLVRLYPQCIYSKVALCIGMGTLTVDISEIHCRHVGVCSFVMRRYFSILVSLISFHLRAKHEEPRCVC